jgi:hypothetical protein
MGQPAIGHSTKLTTSAAPLTNTARTIVSDTSGIESGSSGASYVSCTPGVASGSLPVPGASTKRLPPASTSITPTAQDNIIKKNAGASKSMFDAGSHRRVSNTRQVPTTSTARTPLNSEQQPSTGDAHTSSNARDDTTSATTIVQYTWPIDDVPYQTRINCAQPTLRQFKAVLPRRVANYR